MLFPVALHTDVITAYMCQLSLFEGDKHLKFKLILFP